MGQLKNLPTTTQTQTKQTPNTPNLNLNNLPKATQNQPRCRSSIQGLPWSCWALLSHGACSDLHRQRWMGSLWPGKCMVYVGLERCFSCPGCRRAQTSPLRAELSVWGFFLPCVMTSPLSVCPVASRAQQEAPRNLRNLRVSQCNPSRNEGSVVQNTWKHF